MTNTPSKHALANYLSETSQGLEQVIRKTKELQLLQKEISAYLETAWRKDCEVANLRDGCLVLVTTQATIATQITFKTSELLKQFRINKTLPLIKEIRCKVRPFNASPSQSTRKSLPLLSEETANIIKTMADTIEDKKLQAVMQRIAERVRK